MLRSLPCETAPKTLLENGVRSCIHFCLRSPLPSERREFDQGCSNRILKKDLSTNLCSVAASAVPGPCSQKPLVYFDTEKDEQDEGD